MTQINRAGVDQDSKQPDESLRGHHEGAGHPRHEVQDKQDLKGSEAEHKEHDLIGLPGHELADQAQASETLSKIRAHFQNVSCLLHESHGCSWGSHTCFQRDRHIFPGDPAFFTLQWEAGKMCAGQ